MRQRRRSSHDYLADNGSCDRRRVCVHMSPSHDLDERTRQQDGRWFGGYLSVCRPVEEIVDYCEADLMAF